MLSSAGDFAAPAGVPRPTHALGWRLACHYHLRETSRAALLTNPSSWLEPAAKPMAARLRAFPPLPMPLHNLLSKRWARSRFPAPQAPDANPIWLALPGLADYYCGTQHEAAAGCRSWGAQARRSEPLYAPDRDGTNVMNTIPCACDPCSITRNPHGPSRVPQASRNPRGTRSDGYGVEYLNSTQWR